MREVTVSVHPSQNFSHLMGTHTKAGWYLEVTGRERRGAMVWEGVGGCGRAWGGGGAWDWDEAG